MNKFVGLTKRNLFLYFKDRGAVFFSLLTPIIVLALYLFFLKGTYVNSLSNAAEALKDFINADDLSALASGVLLAGVLGSSLMTVAYNCLTTMVRDRDMNIDYDIAATPLSRVQIVLSYFVSAAICSLVMSLAILFAGLLVISNKYDMYLGAVDILKLVGAVSLGAISATSLFMVVIIFFKDSATSSAFFGLLSAAAGFVIGAYIPLSSFSTGIQNICYLFPATGVTVLIKNLIMNNLLDHMDETIGGVDDGLFVESIKEAFSFNVNCFGKTFSLFQTALYVGIIIVVSIIAISVIYPKIYKRK